MGAAAKPFHSIYIAGASGTPASNNFLITGTATGARSLSLPDADGTFMISPMTTSGDIVYGGTGGVPTRLAKGSDTHVLTLAAGVPIWAAGGGGMVYPDAGIALSTGLAWGTSITNNLVNWNTAYSHTSLTNNPHSVTATQVSLGNVTNESKATMFTSPTFTGITTIATPFILGATSVTTTGVQLNYLSAATGYTGTGSTSLVFNTQPTFSTEVTIDGTAGTNYPDILFKKTGALSASNIGWYFSHKSTNTDMEIYGWDGAAAYYTAINFYTGGIKLRTGATVNEFSTDGTMGDNSDTAVPTEKAVKTYVTATAGTSGLVSIKVSIPYTSTPLSGGYTAVAAVANTYYEIVSISFYNGFDATYDGGNFVAKVGTVTHYSATNGLNAASRSKMFNVLKYTGGGATHAEIPVNQPIYIFSSTGDTAAAGTLYVYLTYRALTI